MQKVQFFKKFLQRSDDLRNNYELCKNNCPKK